MTGKTIGLLRHLVVWTLLLYSKLYKADFTESYAVGQLQMKMDEMNYFLCPQLIPSPWTHSDPVCGDERTNSEGGVTSLEILTCYAMVYPRPASLPCPTIWRRFTVQGSIQLRIQDLSEDMFPAALALLSRHFTADEPPCKYIEINKHPTALAELKKLWSTTMEDGLSLVCVTDDSEAKMVSVNVLTVSRKEDKDEPFHTEDPVWAALFGAVDLVSKGVDIFEKYAVDRHLTAYGLVVDPAWRGLNIGRHMLEARIPLCKALGVKVTATVFTAGASQAVAKKAGFENLFEISYEELARKGFVFPGVEKDTKSSKLMALVIE